MFYSASFEKKMLLLNNTDLVLSGQDLNNKTVKGF